MLWGVGRLFRENLLFDGCDEFTDREMPRVFRTSALGIAAAHRVRRREEGVLDFQIVEGGTGDSRDKVSWHS